MKFLVHSNAPWAGTGYGVQTGLLCDSMMELGHEPHVSAFYGLEGAVIPYKGYNVWPKSCFEPYGNDVIRAHIANTGAQAVVSLIDLFVLDPDIWAKIDVPWIAWTPIDHEEIGPATLRRLELATVPLAMSDFGATEMMKAGIEEVIRIYHAVDTDVYQPLDKSECRAEFGVGEGDYVVGMVMANKGNRKQFPQQFMAVRRWLDQNPDRDIKIFIHTEPSARMGGWDLKSLVAKTGLKGKVYTTDGFFSGVAALPPETMAKVYNCFDILLNVSAGEGFGVPIVEAQSCGVPVVAGNYTAMPELVHNGYVVEPESRTMDFNMGFQFIPSLDDITYRLESVYRMADKSTAQIGRDWVIENCSIPVIAAQWDYLLRTVAGEIQEAADEPSTAASVS